MSSSKWEVNVKPVAGNDEGLEDGVNEGGLVVKVVGPAGPGSFTTEEVEISRVAFDRKQSSNPSTKFKEQLQAELLVAEEVCRAVNDTAGAIAEAEKLRDDARQVAEDADDNVASARDRLREKISEVKARVSAGRV